MKKLNIASLLLLSFIFHTSCDDSLTNECYDYEPNEYDLTISLSRINETDTILVVVYNGDVENENVIDSFDVWDDEFYVYLGVNKYYSAKAFYTYNGTEYEVIDGTEMKTKNSPDGYGDCWTVENSNLYLDFYATINK